MDDHRRGRQDKLIALQVNVPDLLGPDAIGIRGHLDLVNDPVTQELIGC